MKQNKLPVTIDENHVITFINNVLVSHSGTVALPELSTVALPELSTNLVNTSLQLSNGDVILTITSDYFKTFAFSVGHVHNSTIIISEYLCYIVGGRICKILKQLANRGESDPLEMFNIPKPNYDRLTDEQTTNKRQTKAVVSNTLF
jgi:uncharacterized protein YejL (UPF0352 family)